MLLTLTAPTIAGINVNSFSVRLLIYPMTLARYGECIIVIGYHVNLMIGILRKKSYNVLYEIKEARGRNLDASGTDTRKRENCSIGYY